MKYHAFSVSQEHVQELRRLLTNRGIFNEDVKIRPDVSEGRAARMVVATNQEQIHDDDDVCDGSIEDVEAVLRDRDIAFTRCVVESEAEHRAQERGNALSNAIDEALKDLPEELMYEVFGESNRPQLKSKLSYSIYPPLLLLNPSTFQSSGLSSVLDDLSSHPQLRHRFLNHVATSMHVSHIALNAPISASTSSSQPSIPITENILRSPTRLLPLHRNFGPALPPYPTHIPSVSDFEQALWVSTVQNGIKQVWAPRYSMFSAGNVSEKTRLLRLPSVLEAVEEGRRSGNGSAAVDLFAGIGYFAFSYAKAGVGKVLCWDLNPWSVEGCMRGAEGNGWGVLVVEGEALGGNALKRMSDEETRVVAFRESNECALGRVRELRERGVEVPPIRHVNAGMLPSAAMAWRTAVVLVDEKLGGWVHLHESVREEVLDERVGGIMDAAIRVWHELKRTSNNDGEVAPKLEHVERVKSMGPRLMHVVLDIWIPPKG